MFTLFTNKSSVNLPDSQLGDSNQLVSDKLNVTTGDFKLYNVNKTWNTNTSFSVGDIVLNNSRPGRLTYLCTQAGTSSATGLGPQGTLTQQTDGTCVWDYIDAANPLYFRTVLNKLDSGPVAKNSNIVDGTGTLRWRNVSHPSVGWKTSTAYTLGTVVFNQGNNYVCSAAGTSNSTGSGPSSTGTNIVDGVGTLRWDYLAQMPRPWTKSTAYQIGAIVINGSLRVTYRYYICTQAGTSASSGGPLLESSSITDGSVVWSFIPDWLGNTAYSLNTYVNNSGMIYKCTTAGTSGLDLNSVGRRPVNVWSISDEVQAGGSLNQKGALSNWEISHTLGVRDSDVTQSWGGERASTFRINFGEANASVNSLTPWFGATPSTNPFWVGSGIRFTRGGVAPEGGYASGSHLQYYNSIVNSIYVSDNWDTNTVYRVGKRVKSVLTKQTYYCKVAGTSYKSSTNWTPNTSYSVGNIVYVTSEGNYKCTISGISGPSAPTGISESIPDGSVVWTYYDIFLDNPYSTNIQDGSAVWTFIREGARNFNNQRFNEMGWWSDINSSTRTLSGQTLTIVSVDGMAPVEESSAYNVKRGNSLLSFGWKTAFCTSEQGYSGIDPLHGTLLAMHGTETYNFPTAAYGVDLKDVNFNKDSINWAQGDIQGGSHTNIQTGRIRLRNAYLENTSLGANLEVKGYQGIPKGIFLWRKTNSWAPLQNYSTSNSSTNHQVRVPSGMVYTCMQAIVGSTTRPSGYGGYISDSGGRWAWVPTFVAPWWMPGRSYQLGDQVQTTENNVYLCVVAGTSGLIQPTGTGNIIIDGSVTWRLKSNVPANWSATTTYNLGDCVKNSDGLYYICVQSPVGSQTSQLMPSGTGSQIQDGYLLWNFYSATSIRYWLASTSYSQGDIIYANDVYWWCTASGNSASSGTGPSGSGTVTDNTVTWRSFIPQSSLVNNNPETFIVAAGLIDDNYKGTFRLRSYTPDRPNNEYSTIETINTSVCENQPPQGVVDLIVRETQTGRSEYVTFDTSTTTLHSTPLTANLNDWYKDRYLAYYTGPCAGLKRLITAYNASTGELTTLPFPTSPTAGAQVIENFNFNDSISINENQLQNGWIWTVSGGTGTVVVDPEGGIALTGDGSHPACLDQEVTIGAAQQLPYGTECTWAVGYQGGDIENYEALVLTVSIGTTRDGEHTIYPEQTFSGSAARKRISDQFTTPDSGVSIWIRVSVLPAYQVNILNVQMGVGDSATFLPGVRAGVESSPLTLYRHWQPKNILSLQSKGGDLEIGGRATVNGLLSTTKHVLESASNSLVSTGTVRADALQLTASYNRLTTVATGTGVILPSSNVGARIVIFNSGANAVKVYAQGSETIDGVSGSTGVTLTNSLRCEFICIASLTWISAQLGAASA